MNRKLIADYIRIQPQRVVTLDFEKGKIQYSNIKSGREIKDISGDEEMARAFLLTRLANELGYAPERIEIEHEYTAGRPHTITSRIDVVVRDNKGDAFLFIEVKKPEGNDSYATIDKDKVIEEQLYKLAGMEKVDGHKVKYLVLYTVSDTANKVADECIIIDSEKYPTFQSWVDAGREYVNTLPARYGKAQKIPFVKGSEKDLETDFTNETLVRLPPTLRLQ